MGKNKKRTKAEAPEIAENVTVSGRQGVRSPDLGAPCLRATLAAYRDSPEKETAACLLLPTEAFLTANLSTGQLVAVALSSQKTSEEELLPGLSRHSGLQQKPEQPSPLNIWHFLEDLLQLDVPATGSGLGEDIQPVPGEHVLIAAAWPAKLPRGRAALSSCLMATFAGDKAIGKGILVYKVPPVSHIKGSPLALSSIQSKEAAERIRGSSRQIPSLSSLPTSSEWLAKALSTERSRQLLQRAAIWHLRHRRLLHGNPVVLPILGKECFFRVDLEAPTSTWACLEVNADTALTLNVGNDYQQDANQSAANPPEEVAVQRAAEAAAEAVGGGREGPAAQAAARASKNGRLALAGEGKDPLGGIQQQMDALQQLVCLPLQRPELFKKYGVQPPRGVLLWGPPGTGKTRLASATAASASASFFIINGPDVVSAYYGHSEQAIRGIFAAARAASPAVVFIDELDALAPAREGGIPSGHSLSPSAASGAAARAVTTLLTEMQQPQGEERVVVLAATNRLAAVDMALRRPGRFDRELQVGVPSPAARADILRARLLSMKHSLSSQDIYDLASRAHGFVGADLAALCQAAATAALQRAIQQAFQCPLAVTLEDFAAAETKVRPSAMREIAIEVPKVRWNDIGALEEVKQRLQEAVQWPQQHATALARLGAQAPSGILLYGPPGCSKTLLARAVATESNVNFLAVKGPELFSKYVGDTEKALAALFARARAAAPSIIFFDELDGLAGYRSQDDEESTSGVANRILAQLLVEMDGLQSRAGVVVLGATNRPDRIDSALLRPGRFDRLLFVPPPDESARAAILRVQTRKTPLSNDVDIDRLAGNTSGFTGADLSSLVREASLLALQEDLTATEVRARHFAAARQVVQGSGNLSEEILAAYSTFKRQV